MNRDGSDVRRLTNNPAIDSTPTWSPTGTQIAFTSERTGTPQIYVDRRRRRRPAAHLVGVVRRSRDLVAGAVQRDRVHGADRPWLRHQDSESIGTGETRQITFGEGTNESPAWSPNGRHLAFMSTRAGRSQIFTVDRDGKNLRQITKDGNNTTPNWSQ